MRVSAGFTFLPSLTLFFLLSFLDSIGLTAFAAGEIEVLAAVVFPAEIALLVVGTSSAMRADIVRVSLFPHASHTQFLIIHLVFEPFIYCLEV